MTSPTISDPAYPPRVTPDAEHYVSHTTLRGSVITITGLTEKQAADATSALTSDRPVARPEAGTETQTCSRCQGAGGWMETVVVKTSSGGTVTTQKWVNCRPCGGTGQVPKK